MSYIPVIGLEIHAELLTKSKVYCTCSAEFGGTENSRVCPICMALPGTLPLLNQDAVTLAVMAGCALDCDINEYSAFDRKNYFYPDLPKAYQITQFDTPICTNGEVYINGKKIRINRIHIEEDAGKLIHDDKNNVSLADYNRCGVPLIEIVTEPDMHSSDEVCKFVEEIALRLRYAGVCNSRMEQGSLRVDVNISLMPKNSDKFGTRAEIKNLNSFKSITRAIEFEIQRQTTLLDSGKRIVQETRRFDDSSGQTFSLRSKEQAHDYRYFPEPDIPPILLTPQEIQQIKNNMPEMPQNRYDRYIKQYGLSEYDSDLLVGDKDLSDFYDIAVKEYTNYKSVCNLVLGEFLRNLKTNAIRVADVKISPSDLAKIANMSDDGLVSKNAAKDILKIMFEKGGTPEEIAQKNGLIMDNDSAALEEIIDKIINENISQLDEYKNGNKKIFGYLMGQIVKTCGKSINPQLAKKILLNKING